MSCSHKHIHVQGNEEVGYQGACCLDCGIPLIRENNGQGGYEYYPQWQCEICDEACQDNSIFFTNIRNIDYVVCSDDCRLEGEDATRVAERESHREYELYGDDLDSWFR